MKKNILKLFFLLTFVFSLAGLYTCTKIEKTMLVSTGEVTSILTNSAEASGEIIDLGNGAVQHGHCWSKTPNVDVSVSTKTQLSAPSGIGGFTSQLTNLEAGTKYYIKAYLSNGTETVYGKEKNFITAAASTPAVTTAAITGILTNSATSGGNITSDGGAPVTARGVCWNTATGPSISNSKTTDGTGTGVYSSNLSGLAGNTIYYVRAYATNSAGTTYGNELSFTTGAVIPTVTTAAVTSITTSSATTGGNVTDNGGATVAGRGVCYGTSSNPTVSGTKTSDGSGNGVFVSSLTGLEPNTKYYIRAYAINTSGTAYGTELNFTTSALVLTAPTATASAASSVTTTTATINGSVNANASSTAVTFEYGTTILYGSTANATPGTATGVTPTSVSVGLTGLLQGTLYHFRVKAVSVAGTVYSDDLIFTTLQLPAATTQASTSLTQITATLNGLVNANGLSTAITFEYGTSASYGTSVNGVPGSASGSANTTAKAEITGLIANTLYHFRIKAVSSAGTTVGDDLSFTTNASPVVATITTIAASNVTQTTASIGGNITSNGGATVTASGVCWSTSTSPTISLTTITTDGSATGSFSSSITGLTANTTYYVRAYATNSAGTAYGNEQTFTTNAVTLTGPTATASAATSVSLTSATINGSVNANGSSTTVTFEYGTTILYGSTANATPGSATGVIPTSVSAALTGLLQGTLYHFRVKAVSAGGTVYSDDLTLTTLQLPAAITQAATNLSQTTATLNGLVNANGLSTAITFEYGISVSYGTSVNGVPGSASGSANTTAKEDITGLIANTLYHFRIIAVSSAGSVGGDDMSFTTSAVAAVVPTLTTTAIAAITQTTATSGGNISNNGGATVTTSGICWSTSTSPTISLTTKTTDGSATGSFTSSLTGLTANTTYYVRAYATNSVGTAYGNEQTFTTISVAIVAPTVSTAGISGITSNTAACGGNVTSDGGASITARGVCWSTTSVPIATGYHTSDGTVTGTFASSITGLTANTIYYVRAYATNSAGTGYGSELTFKTYTGTVTDVDLNVYNTATIGTQVWMAENLKTTKYRDGTFITNIPDQTEWSALTSGAYCWYDNNAPAYKSIYGAMYNYYTTIDNRNLCPTGWHVPTDAEWTIMTNYLGGESVAGGKLKESGTSHWAAPNTGATNETGFAALPSGNRIAGAGTFGNIGNYGYMWSTTGGITENAWSRVEYPNTATIYKLDYSKKDGLSVRCMQGEGQVLPAFTATATTSITQTTATLNGSFTSDGNTAVSAVGFCWSTSPKPTITDNHNSSVPGIGPYSANITGLTANTLYYVRGYATNSVGTSYSNEVSFTTLLPLPIITNFPAINKNYGDAPFALTQPTSNSSGAFSYTSSNVGVATISGNTVTIVSAGTSTITATQAATTSYASGTISATLTVSAIAPTITTTAISNITTSTSTSGGNISGNGGAGVTASGVCWSQTSSPLASGSHTSDGAVTGVFTSSIAGLSVNTTYYVRAYATNSAGTGYGNELTFKTYTGSVTDVELNVYNTVTIGTQVWMAENLKTTKYRDGSAIPNSTNIWSSLTDGAYCWYNDEFTNKATYGALYNYYATVDNRKLCPTGWHVPTDDEWKSLEMLLGMTLAQTDEVGWRGSDQGSQLKNTYGWNSNGNGINSSGFTALPGGYRASAGFVNIQTYGKFWSSTAQWSRSMGYDFNNLHRGWENLWYGASVRCLQGEGQVLPAVATVAATGITSTSANSGGNVTSDGGAPISERGICYSTSQNPTTSNSKVIVTGTTGSFTANMTGLSASTTYYVRAYAINIVGTVYGNEVSFSTSLPSPTITNFPAITKSYEDATFTLTQPTSNSSGAFTYTSSNVGVATISGNTVTIAGVGTSTITATQAATPSYASGAITALLTVNVSLPKLNTTAVNSIASNRATSGGIIANNGGETITTSGLCWSTSINPVETGNHTSDGTPTGTFVSSMTGLAAGSLYYVRAYAINSAGTGYGNELTFTTATALAIGDSYQGGIVAYILQSGDPGYSSVQTRGLIAAPNDQSSSALWGCYGTTITGADGTAIGTGNQNTSDIVAGCPTAGIAARICDELVLGGYSDWYLPSKDELNKLYLNKTAIGNFSVLNGYVSSTELDGIKAWGQNFNLGIQDYVFKSNTYSVRAIRTFPAITLPVVTTSTISSITSTSATCGGNVLDDGGGTIAARGVCWSTSSNPLVTGNHTSDGTGTGVYASSITGLALGQTYYLRAYATNSAGTSYGSELSFMALAIGDSYQGGKVAYIFQSGDPGYVAGQTHGLIAAASDQSVGILGWNGVLFTGVTYVTIGTGNSNTNNIVSQLGTGTYAARLCYDLILNGYSDWFLPSKDELYKVYLNKAAIGGFASSYYWSSSQSDSEADYAFNFANGAVYSYSWTGSINVRATRSF